jgi:hypothetical protein
VLPSVTHAVVPIRATEVGVEKLPHIGVAQVMMRVSHDSSFDDVEELRKRFEEFRSQHQTRTRLPEELWRAAAEIAGRRGRNLVCRCLRLDTNSLKKWMGKGVSGARSKDARKKRSAVTPPATFVELLTPPSSVAASCIIEVESQHGGKLRLELKGIATSEIAQLIHSFAGQ